MTNENTPGAPVLDETQPPAPETLNPNTRAYLDRLNSYSTGNGSGLPPTSRSPMVIRQSGWG
ncbi:MAG TPA: hypothetical protein VKT25_06415, partial [Ktedonobacteraceae bacterium]|nr:hypothetical protein [Ktedonobacteraceae bacterium]